MVEALTIRADGGVAFEDGADRGRILVSGRDTGGRYALMEYTVAAAEGPAQGYGPHRHGEIEETFLVRTGALEFLLGEEVTTLRAGDFVRVPPGIRHGYANVSGAPVELLVSFHPGGFEELFVKYRTDGGDPAGGAGFMAEATARFGSSFE
jgi:quercetin dioxygenase-like cupin family protein